ncbi:MAG: hypothetical protein AAFZ58_05450 [Pseudomonadota bacterium]
MAINRALFTAASFEFGLSRFSKQVAAVSKALACVCTAALVFTTSANSQNNSLTKEQLDSPIQHADRSEIDSSALNCWLADRKTARAAVVLPDLLSLLSLLERAEKEHDVGFQMHLPDGREVVVDVRSVIDMGPRMRIPQRGYGWKILMGAIRGYPHSYVHLGVLDSGVVWGDVFGIELGRFAITQWQNTKYYIFWQRARLNQMGDTQLPACPR